MVYGSTLYCLLLSSSSSLSSPSSPSSLHLSQHLGFEAWGEANGIVVLFPRLQPHGFTRQTIGGCWDSYVKEEILRWGEEDEEEEEERKGEKRGEERKRRVLHATTIGCGVVCGVRCMLER
jgi:hypothetical protein